jgi:hypothetical protein
MKDCEPIPEFLLLMEAMEHIQDHPLEWTQRYWNSDTLLGKAQCFLGRALSLHGVDIDSDPPSVLTIPHAARVLGLTLAEAEAFFWSQTPDELWILVANVGLRSERLELRAELPEAVVPAALAS